MKKGVFLVKKVGEVYPPKGVAFNRFESCREGTFLIKN